MRERRECRLSISLPPDLHRAAKIKAAQTGQSMAKTIRLALKAWVAGEQFYGKDLATGEPDPLAGGQEVSD